MKFIEFVARVFLKEETASVAHYLDAVINKKTLSRKDRSRPIWRWAFRRWGRKWPDVEYKIRTKMDKHYKQYGGSNERNSIL